MADAPRMRSAFQNPWLAALVGAAVLAASLTLTGNLDVGGQGTFTGEVVAKSGVRLTSVSGPTIRSVTSDPNGSVIGTRGDLRLRTDTAKLYQNTDSGTAWSDVASGLSPVLTFFGDGSDGNATIAIDTALTRHTFYNNLTINAGKTLDPAGSFVFVKGTLTFGAGAKIQTRGTDGISSTSQNTSCPVGAFVGSSPAVIGGNGGNGAVTGVGGGGGNGARVVRDCSLTATLGGNQAVGPNGALCLGGGGGGVVGVAAEAGRSGTNTLASSRTGGSELRLPGNGILNGTPAGGVNGWTGGSGGGGGRAATGAGTNVGGQGGCGGSVVYVFARSISCPSGCTVGAPGSNGGPGANTAGGGGGGGGGLVVVIHAEGDDPSVDVSGGAGGAAGNASAFAGGAGGSGVAVVYGP